ncbi:MAG: hypothetical protein DMG36_07665 [Acidobacteria bacterium]|nr:MAG: hypothetical protein DMG36_07665 [Acidobacteriota bacterium]
MVFPFGAVPGPAHLNVFGGVYLWFFGVQTTSALMVRYQFRKLPGVAITLSTKKCLTLRLQK